MRYLCKVFSLLTVIENWHKYYSDTLLLFEVIAFGPHTFISASLLHKKKQKNFKTFFGITISCFVEFFLISTVFNFSKIQNSKGGNYTLQKLTDLSDFMFCQKISLHETWIKKLLSYSLWMRQTDKFTQCFLTYHWVKCLFTNPVLINLLLISTENWRICKAWVWRSYAE